MKNTFSIGEISKLHNISIKTLRYYDEIGLFQPMMVNPSSGYRYYSTEQFEQLNTINYLKTLGLSLKEIKQQINQGSLEDVIGLLEKHKERTDQKLKELQLISLQFQNRIAELKAVKEWKEPGVATVQKLQSRRIVSIQEEIFSEHQLELTLRKLENSFQLAPSLFIGRVGLTISMANLSKQQFNEYNSVFLLLEDVSPNKVDAVCLEEGQYACVYYRGTRDEAAFYYQRLLAFIEQQQLTIIGDAIERMIVDAFITKNSEEYVTEIQIPVM